MTSGGVKQQRGAFAEDSTFKRAKDKLIWICDELEKNFYELKTFMTVIEQNIVAFQKDIHDKMLNDSTQLKDIRNILDRNYIKVAFFGRTSNGKSSVINAMLHGEVMPSGVGHTTTCFIQLQGSESATKYLTIGNSDNKRPVEDLKKLAHNLCKDKLTTSEILNVFWPRTMYKLLKNDIIIIDTPGINMDDNFDNLIDKYCSDSDIFILVENAVSALSKSEREFLLKIAKRFSKPNSFVLYNHWDTCEDDCEEDTLTLLREEHKKQAVEFLNTFSSPKEIENRIHFISAKKTFKFRSSSNLSPDFEKYDSQFRNFENEFERCISEDAIQIKFGNHSEQVININAKLKLYQGHLKYIIIQYIDQKEKAIKDTQNDLKTINDNLTETISKCKEEIVRIKENVKAEFEKEFNKINPANIINSFTGQFDSDKSKLKKYQKDLDDHFQSEMKKHTDNCHGYTQSELQRGQEFINSNVQKLTKEVIETVNLKYFSEGHIVLDDNNFNADLEYRFSNRILWFFDKTKYYQMGVGSFFFFSTLPIIGLIPAVVHGGIWIFKKLANTKHQQEETFKEQYLKNIRPQLKKRCQNITSNFTEKTKTSLEDYLNEKTSLVIKFKNHLETCIQTYTEQISISKGFDSEADKLIATNLEIEKKLSHFVSTYLNK